MLVSCWSGHVVPAGFWFWGDRQTASRSSSGTQDPYRALYCRGRVGRAVEVTVRTSSPSLAPTSTSSACGVVVCVLIGGYWIPQPKVKRKVLSSSRSSPCMVLSMGGGRLWSPQGKLLGGGAKEGSNRRQRVGLTHQTRQIPETKTTTPQPIR